MTKLFIIIVVMVVSLQLLACTTKPIPTVQSTTFEPTTVPAATTPAGAISTNSITPNSTITTSPKYQQTPTSTQTGLAVSQLTVEEVKHKMDSGSIIVLVDVRSKSDYDKSHIVGAVSIPVEELSRRYTEISQESENIIYGACTWGDDVGTRAVQILLEKGLKNVEEMSQGFSGWQNAAYPVTVLPTN